MVLLVLMLMLLVVVGRLWWGRRCWGGMGAETRE